MPGTPRAGEPPAPDGGQTAVMTSTATRLTARSHTPGRPAPVTITAAVIAVTCCVAFAAANIVFEATGSLFGSGGQYAAAYPEALAIANGLVFALKVIAALVATLAVARIPGFIRPALVGTALWAAFATLAVYSAGNVAEAIAIVTGLTGGLDMITPKTVAYVLFFLVFAVAFGILAVSFTRRYALEKRYIALGALGAPVILGGVLLGLQPLLAAFGLLPAA